MNVHGINDVRQTEIHTSARGWDGNWKARKTQITRCTSPAELIIVGRTIHTEIIKHSIWNKEELPEEWKESIIVSVYKKGNKRDCSNYWGISFLSSTYKILTNILLSSLTPHAEEIIEDHQCGFQRNRSTTDHIFSVCQILEKKWEYNEASLSYLYTSRKPMLQIQGRSCKIFWLTLVHHETGMANKNVFEWNL